MTVITLLGNAALLARIVGFLCPSEVASRSQSPSPHKQSAVPGALFLCCQVALQQFHDPCFWSELFLRLGTPPAPALRCSAEDYLARFTLRFALLAHSERAGGCPQLRRAVADHQRDPHHSGDTVAWGTCDFGRKIKLNWAFAFTDTAADHPFAFRLLRVPSSQQLGDSPYVIAGLSRIRPKDFGTGYDVWHAVQKYAVFVETHSAHVVGGRPAGGAVRRQHAELKLPKGLHSVTVEYDPLMQRMLLANNDTLVGYVTLAMLLGNEDRTEEEGATAERAEVQDEGKKKGLYGMVGLGFNGCIGLEFVHPRLAALLTDEPCLLDS